MEYKRQNNNRRSHHYSFGARFTDDIGGLMELLQPCPNCLEDVKIAAIKQNYQDKQAFAFFIHCERCGNSTQNFYHSKSVLSAIWNALSIERHRHTQK